MALQTGRKELQSASLRQSTVTHCLAEVHSFLIATMPSAQSAFVVHGPHVFVAVEQPRDDGQSNVDAQSPNVLADPPLVKVSPLANAAPAA